MNTIVYFNNGYDFSHRKLLRKFEEKNYNIQVISSLAALDVVTKKYSVLAVIIIDESLIPLVAKFTDKAIICISETNNIKKYEVDNLLFFRSEYDLDQSLEETFKLITLKDQNNAAY